MWVAPPRSAIITSSSTGHAVAEDDAGANGTLWARDTAQVLSRLATTRHSLIGVALATIAAADLTLAQPGLSIAVQGVIDESAHLSTTFLLLLGLNVDFRYRVFVGAAMAASVLIDTDHIPGTVFGNAIITAGTGRPYTHSLVTPLVLLACRRLVRQDRRRAAALGAACGVGSHLLRDLGTGPGVPLLWPLADTSMRMPYAIYAAVLGALAVSGLARRHRRLA